jgi:nitrite reductase/ring-hydroxylating ferredoxin subunit
VAAAEALKDWPIGGALLDEPVVIVRMNGGIAALRDVCCHMDAALSGGWIMLGDSGDELVCPHHRWRYNDAGRCTFIPELGAEQTVPDWARVPRYGVRERYGLIWVCLEEPASADLPRMPALEDPGCAVFAPRPRVWKAPAQDVIERFIAAAPEALGAGEAERFTSQSAIAWSDGASHAGLFAVCPINRTACRSFWVAARKPELAPAEPADRDEQAYNALCQSMAGASA